MHEVGNTKYTSHAAMCLTMAKQVTELGMTGDIRPPVRILDHNFKAIIPKKSDWDKHGFPPVKSKKKALQCFTDGSRGTSGSHAGWTI